MAAVLALVDPAQHGQVASIHDFRVAARSLRATLETLVLRPRTALVRKAQQVLRAAIRAMADTRDRDVGRSLLSRIKAKGRAGTELKRSMLRLSNVERRLALTRSLEEWPEQLEPLLRQLAHATETGVSAIIRRTRAEAWQGRRRAIDAIQALGRRYDPEGLHDLRKLIRGLRYALELLGEVDRTAHARVILLKPLQTALGDAQDNIVLSHWLLEQAAVVRASDPQFSSALRREAGRFRAHAKRAHAGFLEQRPKEVLNRLVLHVDPSYADAAARRRKGPSRS